MRSSLGLRVALAAPVAVVGALLIGAAASSGAPAAAVWPTPASGITYATPTAAARGLALDLLGMEAPRVAPFHGSATSGTVTLRASAAGPATVVSVAKGGAGWVATGSAFADVKVTSPTPGAHVATTVTLSGRSTAFEAVVNYTVRTDAGRVLARGTVMGGSMGAFRAFHASVHIPATVGSGEVILLTRSARDGSTIGASVVRVAF